MESERALHLRCISHYTMRSVELSIPQPCHENWDTFTPTEKGGFCAACQKEVIDFTTWSDEAVLAYFHDRKKSGSACGRFRTGQLRIYALPATNTRQNWIPAAALGATLLLNPTDGHGQTTQTPAEYRATMMTGLVEERLSPQDHVIRGQVLSTKDNSALPGATVLLKESRRGTTTDVDGRFELSIPASSPGGTIVVTFIGYLPQEISLRGQQTLEFHLLEDPTLPEFSVSKDGLIRCKVSITMGSTGVVYRHRYSPRAVWFRFKNLFRFRN